MKNKKFLFAIALSLFMTFTGLVVVGVIAHATTISDLEKEKKELEAKKKEAENEKKKSSEALKNANAKADSLENEMDSIEEEIEETDEALVETLAAIDLINEEIAKKEEELKITTEEYNQAVADEEEQYNAMVLRIKFLYEKGDSTYIQLLLEAQSFSDLMNKAEYIEKLYDYDRRLLVKYQEAKQKTLDLKTSLEEEMDELDADRESLKEEEEYLNEILEEKESEYEDYEAQLDAARAEAASLKASIDKKNAEIKKLESEASAKQSQIDSAKSAQNASGGAQSSGASSTAPSGGSKSYNPASSFNSGNKGQDIVNYAVQFVGNPYVPGGTSLTSGCDCSGYIMRIYKDFGYSLPRTSTSMRTAGVEVSYENARAGDIVCYAGHVALYMGNGRIVHASTQKTGIKYGNINYKPFITIRRIV